MKEKILSYSRLTIEYGFYALAFLVPLTFTQLTYELFEFPKMILVYFLTIIMATAWAAKAIVNGRLSIKRTPLDRPIIALLVVNILATLFSIDRYTSVFGYYTRFNGGLLSLLAYILLFYVFVGEMKDKEEKFIKALLLSSLLVSIYGVLQHLGIDKDFWVQDVQRRVFSTLGQPNWLAAFLLMVIPVTLSRMLEKFKVQSSKFKITIKSVKPSSYILLSVLLYTAFWFTYSLSGLLGFAVAIIIFLVLIGKEALGQSKIALALVFFSWAVISVFTLTPTISGRVKKIFEVIPKVSAQIEATASAQSPPTPPAETGSTIKIRLAVWKGTLWLIRDHPLLGTGPETFAYAFLPYRPVELNRTAEWTFLYNKAHNEYLNIAATTGLLGLAAYLWLLGKFARWNLQNRRNLSPVQIGLFAGWAGLLISNFFGFSVVVTSLLFWLYMALSVQNNINH